MLELTLGNKVGFMSFLASFPRFTISPRETIPSLSIGELPEIKPGQVVLPLREGRGEASLYNSQ